MTRTPVPNPQARAPPPSYDQAKNFPRNNELSTGEPINLVIDGTNIYDVTSRSEPLYELTRPLDGTGKVTGLFHHRHRITGNLIGNPTVSSRKIHVYDFREWHETGAWMEIRGQRPSSYRAVWLVPCFNWVGYKLEVKTVGEAEDKKLFTLKWCKSTNVFEWTDSDDAFVATETRCVVDNTNGEILLPPRLVVDSTLNQKHLNLLVALWCARLWQERHHRVGPKMTWNDVKRIMDNTPNQAHNVPAIQCTHE